MITVRQNKNKDAADYPIVLSMTDGDHYFSVRAAKELRDKLSSVIANVKDKEKLT